MDTRNDRGVVYYRATTDQSLLTRAAGIVNTAFDGVTFAPQHLYIVTWFRVGFFGQATSDTTVNYTI